MHLVLCSFARTIKPCNHITLEWDRAGFDVCLFWYKLPHNYYRGSRSPEAGPSPVKVHVGHRLGEGTNCLREARRYYDHLMESAHCVKCKMRSGWSSVPDILVLRGTTLIG